VRAPAVADAIAAGVVGSSSTNTCCEARTHAKIEKY